MVQLLYNQLCAHCEQRARSHPVARFFMCASRGGEMSAHQCGTLDCDITFTSLFTFSLLLFTHAVGAHQAISDHLSNDWLDGQVYAIPKGSEPTLPSHPTLQLQKSAFTLCVYGGSQTNLSTGGQIALIDGAYLPAWGVASATLF